MFQEFLDDEKPKGWLSSDTWKTLPRGWLVVSALAISIIIFALIFAGALLSMFIRTILPPGQLSEDTKDVMRLSMALIATLAALVVGLLISLLPRVRTMQ